jgi:hypothetical protein
MISDPLTLTANILVNVDTVLGTDDLMNADDAVLDLKAGPGPKTQRSISRAVATSLGFSGLTCSISHTPTSNGRVRSVVRFDAGQVDSNSLPHSGAAYLVVDQEATATAEGLHSVVAALSALLKFVATPVSTTTFKPSTRLAEFMNGEA